MESIVYGEGGFDPEHPDANVVAVEAMPEPEPPIPVNADDLIAGVAAMTDDQKADLRAALGL